MTTALANYRGTDSPKSEVETYAGSYGAAPQGIYRRQTTDVGTFPPNAFGLYDMHGNVREWCLDYWHDNYRGAPPDGSAWVTGGDSTNRDRVLRGGSWIHFPLFCRSAYRFRLNVSDRNVGIGFRVVCSA